MSTRAAAPSPTSNTEPLPEDPAARAAEIARRRTLLARAEAPASVEGGRIQPHGPCPLGALGRRRDRRGHPRRHGPGAARSRVTTPASCPPRRPARNRAGPGETARAGKDTARDAHSRRPVRLRPAGRVAEDTHRGPSPTTTSAAMPPGRVAARGRSRPHEPPAGGGGSIGAPGCSGGTIEHAECLRAGAEAADEGWCAAPLRVRGRTPGPSP